MSTLTDLLATEIPKHHGLTFTDDGDWICLCGWGAGEPMDDLPGNHYRHRAEVAAAVVVDWLESAWTTSARDAILDVPVGPLGESALESATSGGQIALTVSEAEQMAHAARFALAAEARKGADQ